MDAALRRLVEQGSLALDAWPRDTGFGPEEAGFAVVGDRIRVPAGLDLLREADVRSALGAPGRAWLRRLEIFRWIGSTNTYLMREADSIGVDGRLCLAEFQATGRGRRGRGWVSPFARNLAMSLGVRVERPLNALGGLSSVVGIALVETLNAFGEPRFALKWPNDVWLDDRKVCGILVELAQRHGGAEVVIGIGVNVRLDAADRAAIDQAAADVRAGGVRAPRSELAGRLAAAVVAMVREFEHAGFSGFVERFDALHRFHGQPCRILIGARVVDGTVVGVDPGGELLLRSGKRVQRFSAGEVSLRPA